MLDINSKIIINNKEYEIIKLLGKGKGGYSYLARFNNEFYVVKKIHHEPCSYYSFGNKIQSEYDDYKHLLNLGICIPKMIYIDFEQEIIVKEYIDGDTIFDIVLKDEMKEQYYIQIKKMCEILYRNSTNIDYFPTNFVVQNEVLYYIDYECNKYMEEWNFENWGIKYWYKTKELEEYINSKGE